jgi:hypothetical protein
MYLVGTAREGLAMWAFGCVPWCGKSEARVERLLKSCPQHANQY